MRPILHIAALCLMACSTWARDIDTATGIPPASIVIVGEVHDNPLHHQFQADVIAAQRPAAVVFEMLSPEQAAAITPDLLGDAAALGDALHWEASGWPAFDIYYPIFAALGEARVYGAAVPRDTVRAAIGAGAAAVFDGDAARFGLDKPLPEAEQAAREADQQVAHCNALPEQMLGDMVEAQRLRDATFAAVTAEALSDTGGPVIVITGNGHTRRDHGIPAALAHAGITDVIAIGQFEEPPEGDVPFDLWRVTDPVDRDDPCAAFSK
ncbi:MAG: ChaN family lipoprotein [Pseudomonadota bacterium]|nr:ChaN family lipoprotein [Pseudomonadota bacterium]